MKLHQLTKGFLVGAMILSAHVTFAAYNDVVLTTDVTISLGDTTLSIAGASNALLNTLRVDATTVSFVMETNSTVKVSSSDLRQLVSDSPSDFLTQVCTSGESSITLDSSTATSSTAFTVHVTPQSTTCPATTSSSSSSGSNSNGGGGIFVPSGGPSAGGDSTSIAVSTPSTPSISPPSVPSLLSVTQINSIIELLKSFGADQSVIEKVQASLTGAVVIATLPETVKGHSFTRLLQLGTTHTDVKMLQIILNSHSDTIIASSGVGSAGKETNYFGSLTKKAVGKFQEKYGIAKPGNAGYGLVGPMTRKKLNEIAQ